ncbi:hypothetical protein CRUP_022974 [Coryphaenoides rupestris]|nr:hypothetical protein CRUP_022974 [Coryphaenoides rupestris]
MRSRRVSLTGTHRAEQLRYYQSNCMSSPEMLSPLKPVPQIRIDMDPDDDDEDDDDEDLVYLRHVPLRKVHLFTFIQVLCLALLWVLKSTVAAIIFPVMLSFLDDVIPEKDKKRKEDEKKKKKRGSVDSDVEDSDYPYNEKVPSIKIPMDMMEKEPFLGDKSFDNAEPSEPVPQIRIDMDPDDR